MRLEQIIDTALVYKYKPKVSHMLAATFVCGIMLATC